MAQGSSHVVASLMVAIVQGLGLQYNLAPSEFPPAVWDGIGQMLRRTASGLRIEGHRTTEAGSMQTDKGE